jgi:hypothetical protein
MITVGVGSNFQLFFPRSGLVVINFRLQESGYHNFPVAAKYPSVPVDFLSTPD